MRHLINHVQLMLDASLLHRFGHRARFGQQVIGGSANYERWWDCPFRESADRTDAWIVQGRWIAFAQITLRSFFGQACARLFGSLYSCGHVKDAVNQHGRFELWPTGFA